MKRTSPLACLVALAVCCMSAVHAAAPVDVVEVDLAALIDRAAQQRNRFAVDVPHAVTASTHGEWESIGTTRRWTYSVRIPTAVSMSFHAARFSLPPSAVLTLTGTNANATYTARDANRGGLWARPLRGDTLTFSLSVDAAEANAVRLEIASFQAGYRSLGGSVPDHPRYKRHSFSIANTAADCVENYTCNMTNDNSGPGRAIVGLLIGNTAFCTGTLLNNARLDSTPYILTARHCQEGDLGGGNPGAAASVIVFWDALTPCGTLLGSVLEGSTYTQGGATTIVEQQDAWLIELDGSPAGPNVYFAGWDATGAAFTGGYAIHHSQVLDKQYVAWFGQAILQRIAGSTLGVGYESDYWGVVHQFGSVGAGASGGALFDPSHRVVGNASLGVLTDGPGSPGVCPVDPPSAPSPSTVTAQYTALSAIWNSTIDATSTTGVRTMRSVLDPDGSGQLVIPGQGHLRVTLSANRMFPQNTGQSLTLTWSAPGAQTCTATGGTATDGWAGSRPSSGSMQLTEDDGGLVTYSLKCRDGDRVGGASVSVDWQFVPLRVFLTGPQSPLVAGTTARLQWASDGSTCTASGGINGDGWAGPKATTGSQEVIVSTIGTITYTLTCQAGTRTNTAQHTITATGPTAELIADFNNLRFTEWVVLSTTIGGECTPTGGMPGDNWNGTTFLHSDEVRTSVQFVREQAAGTYTYGITCTGGGQTVSASVVVTFTDAAPAATLTAVSAPQEIPSSDSLAHTTPNLSWTSNVRDCRILSSGPGGRPGPSRLGAVFPVARSPRMNGSSVSTRIRSRAALVRRSAARPRSTGSRTIRRSR
jgi:lysyl endopeptidase